MTAGTAIDIAALFFSGVALCFCALTARNLRRIKQANQRTQQACQRIEAARR
jgi:Tfp pilus assembly protein PilV